MALVTLKEILTHATENNYAVGSFNAVDFNIVITSYSIHYTKLYEMIYLLKILDYPAPHQV